MLTPRWPKSRRRVERPIALQGDLRFVADCERVVAETAETFGGLDILVNNAGVTRSQSIDDTTEELYDEMFDLNMKGYFFCAQAALPWLDAPVGARSSTSPRFTAAADFRIMPPSRDQRRRYWLHTLASDRIGAKSHTCQRDRSRCDRGAALFRHAGLHDEFGHTLIPWGRVGKPMESRRPLHFWPAMAPIHNRPDTLRRWRHQRADGPLVGTIRQLNHSDGFVSESPQRWVRPSAALIGRSSN